MKNSVSRDGETASKLIDRRIRELGDWRGRTLEKVRRLIKEVDPEIVEEWKWMGTPVWSHGGIVWWIAVARAAARATRERLCME
jgi:hypothetical protein